MEETEWEKQDKKIRNAKEESDMEWVLAGLLIIIVTSIFTL